MPDDNKYQIIPLLGEDGLIHYSNKPKPIFDNIGSASPDNRVDNDLLLNLMKHSRGSIGVTPNSISNYIEGRARNQSTTDRMGNVFMQTLGEIIGGTLESTGSIFALPSKLIGDNEAYTRNFLEQIGTNISESTREAFPIYMTQQAQTGSILDRMQGGGYWAQLLPSVIGSAASIMLPARGATILLGKIAKSGLNYASKARYAKDVTKLSEALLRNTGRLDKFNRFNNVYNSAIVSRVLDSSREAYGTYEQERQWFLDNYDRYIERDENGNAILKRPGGEEVQLNNTDDIEAMADEYADRAASRGYWLSMSNIAYDVIEWTGIMGAARAMSNATRNNIRKIMGTDDKFSAIRALNAIPAAATVSAKPALMFAAGSLSEMADEMTMSIAMKEGAHSTRKDYGLLTDMDNASDFGDRLKQYIQDPDIITEGIGGLLGGAGMQMIMPTVEKLINKGGIKEEERYVKGLEASVDAMRTGLDNIAEKLAVGDLIGAKMTETQSIIDQVAANSLDGSLDFYKEMLRNMSSSLTELQKVKDRMDRGETVTEEEQKAVEAAGSMLNNVNYFNQILNKVEAVQPIFEKYYKQVNRNSSPEEQKVSYELNRRRANYEAHKVLNEQLLEDLSSNPIEYEEAKAKAQSLIDDYVNQTTKDINAANEKKTEISKYFQDKQAIDMIKSMIDGIDESISQYQKKLDEVTSAINGLPKEEKGTTKHMALLAAKRGGTDKIEFLKKQLADLRSTRDELVKDQEAAKVTKEDIKAVEDANVFAQNTVDPENAAKIFESQRAILDAELSYLNTPEAYDSIKEQVKLYEDQIKASTNEDLIKELGAYKSATALEKDADKFKDSTERTNAYEARLRALKAQEKADTEARARQEAVLKAAKDKREAEAKLRATKKSDEVAGEELETRDIEDKPESFGGLSQAAMFMHNALESTAQMQGKSILEVALEEKPKTTIQADKDILTEIINYYTGIEDKLNNTFGRRTVINPRNLALESIKKYMPFSGMVLGLPFTRNITTADGTKQYTYTPDRANLNLDMYNFLSTMSEMIRDFYASHPEDLPAAYKEVNYGTPSTSNSDIQKIVKSIENDIKTLNNRFDEIDNILLTGVDTKNPINALYVSINGKEYRILSTKNAYKEVGLTVEGLGVQINRYMLVPENVATANDAYVLVAKRAGNAAPDLSYSPTGDQKAPDNITKQTVTTDETVDASNSIDTTFVETEKASDSSDTTTSDISDLELTSNGEFLAFEMPSFDTKVVEEFIASLIASNAVNFQLIDTNMLAWLGLLAKQLKQANKRGGLKIDSDAFVQNLMQRYLTEDKLEAPETKLINVAKELSSAMIIDFEAKRILNKNNSNLNEIFNKLNDLSTLYKDKKKFEKDIEPFRNIHNLLVETDIVTKASQVLMNLDGYIDPNKVNIQLDRSITEKAKHLVDIPMIFSSNFSLFTNLVAFISERNGMVINRLTLYDVVQGMREFRGDTYEQLIPEIMAINNIIRYLSSELKIRAQYYEKQWTVNKNKVDKEAYDAYKFFSDLIDMEATKDKLLTADEIAEIIRTTELRRSNNYREGLDIKFDSESSPRAKMSNVVSSLSNLGIYEILDTVQVGDTVEIVQTDDNENTNRASYDIYYTKDGIRVKLGTMPQIEDITNGIAYVTQGENGVYNVRKFTLTDEMLRTFAENQNLLFRFMYHYQRAKLDVNNVSPKAQEESNNELDIIMSIFTNSNNYHLIDVFKQLIYSNLSAKQVNSILSKENELIGIFNNSKAENGSLELDEVSLSLNQIYQICTDLFDGVKLTEKMGRGIVSPTSINKRFHDSTKRHELIFKHNQAIRNDIKMTESTKFRVSAITPGNVIINDENDMVENVPNPLTARSASNKTVKTIGIDHHRNSLLTSVKPIPEAVDKHNNPRVQIVRIGENGKGYDVKTGGSIKVDKITNDRVGNVFTKNRGTLYVTVPQTDQLYTLFPVKNNTIIGSITDDDIDTRRQKLLRYTEYIRENFKAILGLKEGDIAAGRLALSNKLQNVIICNELSNPLKDPIHFQSDNNEDGSKRSIMFRTVMGVHASLNNQFHKFIQTEIDGRDVVIYYSSANQKDVSTYNGSLDKTSYPNIVYYLDNAQDVEALDNRLNALIPHMVRQFGLTDNIATSKDGSGSSYDNGYVDPVTGQEFNSIYDYYMETNAIYSNVGYIKDTDGNIVSNVTVDGVAPIKFSIAPISYDTALGSTTRFYDPVEMLKTVAAPELGKEDWASIASLANILEYEAGVNPVYVLNRIKMFDEDHKLLNYAEGDAGPVKIHNATDMLPNGFNYNYYKVTINYDPELNAKQPRYITRALAHEMLHTYMMKFFNVTQRDLRNSDLVAKREALIRYNNEQMIAFFEEFKEAALEAKKSIFAKDESKLTKEERQLSEYLKDDGFAWKLIQVMSNEIKATQDRIATKEAQRAKGEDVVLTGLDAIQDVITNIMTNPAAYQLANLLKAKTSFETDGLTIETPTIWQKLRDVLLKIFQKIFNFDGSEVKENSLLDKLSKTIDKIYSQDYRDFIKPDEPNGALKNPPTPGREKGEVRSETPLDNATTTEDAATKQEAANIVEQTEVEPESTTETKEVPVDDFDDLFSHHDVGTVEYDADNVVKLSYVLDYAGQSLDNRNINRNLDDTGKEIC